MGPETGFHAFFQTRSPLARSLARTTIFAAVCSAAALPRLSFSRFVARGAAVREPEIESEAGATREREREIFQLRRRVAPDKYNGACCDARGKGLCFYFSSVYNKLKVEILDFRTL